MPPGYKPKDSFYQKAKKESFAARSVYKLEEIDDRFSLFRKNQKIVDLGCSPGSWLQYLGEVVGPKGLVLGYDLVAPRVSVGPQVVMRVADVYALSPELIRTHALEALGQPSPKSDAPPLCFDAVVSDMMPKTTGVRDADQAASIGVVEAALHLALELLEPDGVFVAKVFQGRGFDEVVREVRKALLEVRVLKPKATRQGSRESFIVAKGRRPGT